MDVVFLSRLQFAAATMFHFLFVPLTLGLSIMMAYMETKYVRTKNPVYLSMTKFWGKLFLINFALGVVTGITLEFQFGTNWSRYSAYVGDVFGSFLAIEATVAFFLESILIGIWVFGWKKLSAKAHAFVMWLIAIGGSLSAVWILIANAWMQHPVGYTIRNGRAELTDFMAVVTQKFAVLTILHTLSAAYVLSAFFVMSVSAWHLLKKNNVEFFTKSFRIALVMGLLSTIFVVAEGDVHAVDVAKVQPAKLAAMETHWETSTKAPVFLFSWPDEENEKNIIEIGRIPGVLSFLAFHDINAPVQGLKEFPKDERPPVAITALAFKVMVGSGFYFLTLMILGWFFRNKLIEKTWFLKLMVISLPLPYIAIEAGWVLAEVGRQPWIVYGLLKTSDAASPIASGQVLTTLIGFIVLYGLLGVAGFYMIFKNALKGPKDLTQ
ncbi:MAG: cytochrome ubiquinol oxidase subunit I [Desulforegulaceae bacterium]|nr:cytochrome ubiquinol oxidase subunit I [Desulforegulaceae bacterium]